VEGLLAPTPVGEVCKPFGSARYKEDQEKIKPTETYYEHLNEIDPGWNYKQLTDWAGYPSREDRTFLKSPFVAERRYWNFLLVLDPKKPSWTIPAVYGSWNGPFHWKQSAQHPRRRLRTSEIAAIQDFPPSYVIAGSWRERVRQLGNAVPPAMAAAMITQVARSLENSSV
jgi:DNA (cytosine-5)-methyltransferase 1